MSMWSNQFSFPIFKNNFVIYNSHAHTTQRLKYARQCFLALSQSCITIIFIASNKTSHSFPVYLSSGALSISNSSRCKGPRICTSQSYPLSQMVAYPTSPSCICLFKFSMLWMDSSSPLPPPRAPACFPYFLHSCRLNFSPLSSYLHLGYAQTCWCHLSQLSAFFPASCAPITGSVGQRLSNWYCVFWIQSFILNLCLSLLSLASCFIKQKPQLHGHPWLKVVLTLLPFLLPASPNFTSVPPDTLTLRELLMHGSNPRILLTPILWFTHYLPDLS